MRALQVVKSPYTRLVINLAYAVGNCAVGFLAHSWWFITIGAYYAILTITRFSVLRMMEKDGAAYFAKRITGFLLVMLSFCIVGVNILSAVKDRGTAFHEIVMIAIATYTFAKITVAIIRMAKAKHATTPRIKTLRNISLADACVSVYAMQRSMLVSFPGMAAANIQILNILTGTAVWLIVFLLGVNLIGGKYTDMAKSKIVKTTEQIADAVTGGYKKIEKVFVDGYTKIEDKFVDAYLVKDGETIEDAKARLKNDSK